MVTERDFLEMKVSLWLNKKFRNGSLAKGWLSTLPYAAGKHPSMPPCIINRGRKWSLRRRWSWWNSASTMHCSWILEMYSLWMNISQKNYWVPEADDKVISWLQFNQLRNGEFDHYLFTEQSQLPDFYSNLFQWCWGCCLHSQNHWNG